jgi:hypothetical protein
MFHAYAERLSAGRHACLCLALLMAGLLVTLLFVLLLLDYYLQRYATNMALQQFSKSPY